jgi:hypothetical protein
LQLGDKTLKPILQRLYWPDGPYDFRVLPPEILGQVYEQFLGKIIKLRPSRSITVEEKPEVRKAGGVYYTPSRVVEFIVTESIGPALAGKTPLSFIGSSGKRNVLRICDPACGSGSFLIAAYQYLLDWYLAWYAEHEPEAWAGPRRQRIWRAGPSEWRLTTKERKRILLEHIYGVVIDAQAVEVTKLSLLLKVLEGETEDTLGRQLRFFHERALPDLDQNIKCGNSLIGNSFHLTQGILLTRELQDRINAFDWDVEYPEVMQDGGFDIIIGNPPWLMAGYYLPEAVPYLHDQYISATGKFDLYYVFLEQADRLLNLNGRLGMIVPNKFFHTRAARSLRQLLLERRWLYKVVDFGIEKVFQGATNYSCILFMAHSPSELIDYAKVTADLAVTESFEVPWTLIGSDTWTFQDSELRQLLTRIEQAGSPLRNMISRFGTGVQSGADRLLTFEQGELDLEPEVVQRMLRGRDVRRYRVQRDAAKSLIFPYEIVNRHFKILSERRLAAFPRTYAYLQKHKRALAERKWFGRSAIDLSGKWYGMMYLDAFTTFDSPHILTPSLSDRSNFAIGTGDLFATGTAGVTSLVPASSTPEDIRYLLGLLNSDVLTLWITSHSPPFQGGFYKFSGPYLEQVPIRRIDFHDRQERQLHDRIVQLIDLMQQLHADVSAPDTAQTHLTLRRRIAATDSAINSAVASLYGLKQSDETLVEVVPVPVEVEVAVPAR